MFKHTYTSISERYLLNEKIQCYLLDGIDNLMKRIELSLLYNAYPNIDEEKKIDLELNNFKELREALAGDLIKERIRRLNIVMEEKENILNLDQIESKMLLITLYEYYLREEMVEYVDFLDFDKEKNVKGEKIEENFKTFINNYKDEKYLETEKIMGKYEPIINNLIYDYYKALSSSKNKVIVVPLCFLLSLSVISYSKPPSLTHLTALEFSLNESVSICTFVDTMNEE